MAVRGGHMECGACSLTRRREHYAGNFPLWLAPEQVRILTIGDDAKLIDYSMSILNELRLQQVRAEIDKSTDQINGKSSGRSK
jgi:threonyl-tRNA synthetase